jgi:hypothetical protein
VLDFPSSVCRKVRRCKSNEWVYPQKQACLKKEEKNTHCKTHKQQPEQKEATLVRQTAQQKQTAQVSRDLRNVTLSSPCLWASCHHPPNLSFSGIRNAKFLLDLSNAETQYETLNPSI